MEHYQQNVNDDNYTIVSADTQNLTGTTGAQVTPAVKTYTGFKSPAAQTVTIAADGSTVVKYYYDRLTYTVTLTKGTGIASVSGAGTYRYGQSVTINATASAGYKWNKWTGTHSTTTQKYTFTMPASNVADTANATIINYTISYTLNSGSVSGNPTSYNVTTATFTLKNPTRTGYTFTGWTGTGLSSATKTVTVAKGSTGNRSYTANWQANSYTIAYNANGGSGSMANTSATYDKSVTLRANAFFRTGYTFNGWNTRADGKGTSYEDKASVKNLATSGTVTLYAQWKPITYTIVYHGNGATGGSTATSTHTYGTAKALTGNGFTKTDGYYRFIGWSTSPVSNYRGQQATNAVVYTNGQSVLNLRNTSGTVNLYAVWTYYRIDLEDSTGKGGQGKNSQNYLWQEHPCASPNGYFFDLGYDKAYGYSYNTTFDISRMMYFHFDIKMTYDNNLGVNGSQFKALKAMTGQLEFSSSGTYDNAEMAITWENLWKNAVWQDGGDGWISVYVPLDKMSQGAVKTAINFTRVYWNNGSGANQTYVGQMANPFFQDVLPGGTFNTFDLLPEEVHDISLIWDGIDDTNMEIWYPVDEQYPVVGDSYELAFEPMEGYTMSEIITVAIPDLELELPVMAEWDYNRLNIAPCRHFGSTRTDDLVIAAHNYTSHFGSLAELEVGAEIRFTDMDGTEHCYMLEKMETLSADAVDAVQNSGYDLVLYTCAPGGVRRVVAFCNRKDASLNGDAAYG